MTSIKSIAGRSLVLLITLGAISVQADVNPAALFTDNMVIQQQTDAAIWGWADNPDTANLYNKEELPASPFSTN